ncbi:outer membrane preprotein PIIc [Neisseria gonorrhoeae]|nr:outer membrane preprotein PIIc [Neisseria gonorrhoeae]
MHTVDKKLLFSSLLFSSLLFSSLLFSSLLFSSLLFSSLPQRRRQVKTAGAARMCRRI